jgi:hypothetical protein
MKKFLLHILMILPAAFILSGFGSAVLKLDFNIVTNDPIVIYGCVLSIFCSLVAAVTSFYKSIVRIHKVFLFSPLPLQEYCLLSR